MDLVTCVLIAVFVLWNIVTFVMYAIDKSKAKNNKWRISEACLIASAFCMGGIGAFLGMTMLRHKTKHLKFRLLLPLAVIVNAAVIWAFWHFGIIF